MYSLVIPVYKNEATIPGLLDALEGIHKALDDALEVVFVVDGSPDRSYELLRTRLADMPFASQLLLHSRNYGSFAGIRSGLQAAKGQFFAVMAADLQEPPELILEFFRKLKSDQCDVAIGARESRDDPALQRLASRMFWWFYRTFVIPEIPQGGVDVFGCNQTFRDALLKLRESHSSLIGLVFWLGFRREVVAYDRRRRQCGESSWTFHKKLDYLMDSIFAFSDLPVKILLAAGGAGLFCAVLFGSAIVALRVLGGAQAPGYAAIMVTILFFGALNMVGLGIVGSYVWRAYANAQHRPLSVVMRAEEFAGNSVSSAQEPSGGKPTDE